MNNHRFILLCERVQVVAPHVHIDVDATVFPGSPQDSLSGDAFLHVRRMPSNVRVRSNKREHIALE